MRCIPGGKIEVGQHTEEAAIEETRQETGLEIEIVRFLAYRDDMLPTGHFITLYFEGRVTGGTLQTPPEEAHKICDLTWTPLDEIGPLFTGCHCLLPLLKNSEAAIQK